MSESDDEQSLSEELEKELFCVVPGVGMFYRRNESTGGKFSHREVLGEKLWRFLNYEGSYDRTLLAQMYQAFLSHETDKRRKQEFLNQHLTSSEIPHLYDAIYEAALV